MKIINTYTAFEDSKLLAHGSLQEVVLKIKKKMGKSDNHSAIIFSDETGKSMDFNFQGTEKDVLKRLEVFTSADEEKTNGPGRPKLGVMSREVSLLPRHWEWLATQSGCASATIRRLVEEAKKKSSGGIKQAQECTYKFMSVMAGDFPNYEEALRALYKRDEKNFTMLIEAWPKDIRKHSMDLAATIFSGD
jgi:hypothetical protein